ncbi:MAG: hypothetical protein HQK49_19505 [Oligoflexia bacterium]|nr:hypothetical protein [Oligoflexia bacterium]
MSSDRNFKIKTGEEIERVFSKSFHQQGIPILVSPLVLHEYGCGQVDFCRMNINRRGEKSAQLVEVKSGSNLSKKQYHRIKRSINLLSQILSIPVYFTFESACLTSDKEKTQLN